MRASWSLSLTLTLLVACGDDKNTTASSTGGETDSSSSGSSSNSTTSTTSTTNPTTTDNSGTIGGSATMGETTDLTGVGPGGTSDGSTSGSTSGSSSSASSTTGGPPDIPGACKAFCGKAITDCMIDGGGTLDECTMGCIADLGGSMGACADATLAFLDCLQGLECAALDQALNNGQFGTCTDAAMQQQAACMDMGMCTNEVGGNMQMTACSITINCPNQPTQVMNCEGKQCTCLVDGMKTGQCMSDNVCMMPDTLPDKATACCGF